MMGQNCNSFQPFRQVKEQEHTLERDKDSAASRMTSLNPSASFYVRNRGSNVNVSGGGGGNGLSDTAPKFLLFIVTLSNICSSFILKGVNICRAHHEGRGPVGLPAHAQRQHARDQQIWRDRSYHNILYSTGWIVWYWRIFC